MRTIFHIMEPGKFHEAILAFLAINRDSVITSEQFMAHLELFAGDILLPEDQSLSNLIYEYENAMPSINAVEVTQLETHFEILKVTGEMVNIPVDYMTPTTPPASRPRHWGLWREWNRIEVDLQEWILVNPELYGLYPVMYSEPLWTGWAAIVQQNHTMIPSFNRAQLISDSSVSLSQWWIFNHLNMIRYLPNERDSFAWRAARIGYESLAMRMREYEGAQDYYDYYKSLVRDLYAVNRIGQEMKDFELAMEVAKIACYSGHQECVQDVEAYYDWKVGTEGVLLGSSDFQVLIYHTLAKHSSTLWSVVDRVEALWRQDRGVHAESRSAVQGLAYSTDPNVAYK